MRLPHHQQQIRHVRYWIIEITEPRIVDERAAAVCKQAKNNRNTGETKQKKNGYDNTRWAPNVCAGHVDLWNEFATWERKSDRKIVLRFAK